MCACACCSLKLLNWHLQIQSFLTKFKFNTTCKKYISCQYILGIQLCIWHTVYTNAWCEIIQFKVEIACASSYYSTIAICICIDDNNRNTEQSELETVLVCEHASTL